MEKKKEIALRDIIKSSVFKENTIMVQVAFGCGELEMLVYFENKKAICRTVGISKEDLERILNANVRKHEVKYGELHVTLETKQAEEVII